MAEPTDTEPPKPALTNLARPEPGTPGSARPESAPPGPAPTDAASPHPALPHPAGPQPTSPQPTPSEAARPERPSSVPASSASPRTKTAPSAIGTDAPADTPPTSAPPSAPRRSPLHDVHVAAGAALTEFAGWTMPLRYSGDLAEHHAVRRAAGLFDLSHMAEIVVLGPQAPQALDAALLGEPSTSAIGQARYTLLLNGEGGVIDDVVVYRTGDDRYLIVANAANREVVVSRLRDRVVGFDAVVQDETDDIGLIALQGPRALDVLLEVEGFGLADGGGITEAHFRERLAALPNYRFLAAAYDGHPVLIARTGYTGERGYELYAAPELLPRLWSVLLDAGAGSGVVPAGLAARDTLRLEAGMPLYGHELTALTTPQQAGLGRLVRRDKAADYVGRAAVEGAPAPGRVLVGLVADGRRAGRAGYLVYAADREVGVVTSGALSPTLGRPIAMAYVDADAVDGPLTIDVRGTRLPATTTPLPFYSRKA